MFSDILETDSYMHKNLNYFCIKVSTCLINILFIYLNIYTLYATYKYTYISINIKKWLLKKITEGIFLLTTNENKTLFSY